MARITKVYYTRAGKAIKHRVVPVSDCGSGCEIGRMGINWLLMWSGLVAFANMHVVRAWSLVVFNRCMAACGLHAAASSCV